MNKILGIVVGLVFLVSSVRTVTSQPTFTLPTCLQNQYGDRYDKLTVDNLHHIVTGIVTPGSMCSNQQWIMVGSWTVNRGGDVFMELSVANNTNSSASCVPIYKLKGAYPNADWYYDFGLDHNQTFTYAACSASSPIIEDTGTGGVHGASRE